MQNEGPFPSRTVCWLFVGFIFTGVGTVLLGCLLPNLSALWQLNDTRAGTLFAAQFSGSALGALLVDRRFLASVLRGYLLLIASATAIAYFPSLPEAIRFFVFGLGLGLSMTSSSMVIGALYARSRGKALSWLNGFWTIGAALGPALASVWVKRWPPTYLFLALGASMLVVLGFLLGDWKTLSVFASAAPVESRPIGNHLHLISLFAALGCLYVGVEASVSGWMMSYIHRLPDAGVTWAPITVSIFWLALLSGRMLAPAVLEWISEDRLLSASIAVAFITTALVLLERSPLGIALAVAATGLALGPIYPLCLSKALGSMNDSPRAKWVFAISGSGGAVLPWITGLFSSHEASLHTGLLVPAFALAMMIVLNRMTPTVSPA